MSNRIRGPRSTAHSDGRVQQSLGATAKHHLDRRYVGLSILVLIALGTGGPGGWLAAPIPALAGSHPNQTIPKSPSGETPGVHGSPSTSAGRLRLVPIRPAILPTPSRLPRSTPIPGDSAAPTPTKGPSPSAIPRIPPARWIVENVRDYGAKGNDAIDDTHAFVSAVAAARAAGGGTVFVPAGRYLVSQVRLYSGVSLKGESRAKTIIQQSGVSGTQLDGSDATVYLLSTIGGGVENLTIRGTDGRDDEILLALNGARNARFDGLTIDRASGRGIYLASFASATSGNVFSDVRITNTQLTKRRTRGESLWLYAGPSHNTFVNVSITNGATKGLSLDAGSATGPYATPQYNEFKNLVITDAGRAGTWTAAIDLEGATHNHFDGFVVRWTVNPKQADAALYVTEDQNVIPSDYNTFENGTLTNLPGRAFELLSSNHNTFRNIVVQNVERVWDFAGQGNLVFLGWGFELNGGVMAGSCSNNSFDNIKLTQSFPKTHYQYGVVMSPGDATHRDAIEIMRNSFANITWASPVSGGYRVIYGSSAKAPSSGSSSNVGLPGAAGPN
jgi:Pectate lyase superfamily protein